MAENGPKRQVVRGTTAAFEELFVDPVGNALVPVDSTYPQVSITDAKGTVLSTGTGSLLNSEGRYRFTWFAPVDADLTDCDDFYEVSWLMLTSGGQQSEKTAKFQVVDNVDINPTERAFTYLTMQGESERAMIRFRQPPEELSLRIVAPDNTAFVVNSISEFMQRSDQGGTIFYHDSPPLTGVGCYLLIWKSRETQVSSAVTSVQQLRVPEGLFYQLAPSLRMALDKAQKKSGLVQAYSDPDMYEYLVRGVDLLNAVNPITSWTLNSVPQAYGFSSYLLLEAMVWALRAQFLSEIELGFSFSGQTVTLDVDRSSGYESMLSNIQDFLTTNLQNTKRNWLRRQSVGHFAGRPYDFGLTSLVMPVQNVRGGQQQLLPLLSQLGVI